MSPATVAASCAGGWLTELRENRLVSQRKSTVCASRTAANSATKPTRCANTGCETRCGRTWISLPVSSSRLPAWCQKAGPSSWNLNGYASTNSDPPPQTSGSWRIGPIVLDLSESLDQRVDAPRRDWCGSPDPLNERFAAEHDPAIAGEHVEQSNSCAVNSMSRSTRRAIRLDGSTVNPPALTGAACEERSSLAERRRRSARTRAISSRTPNGLVR